MTSREDNAKRGLMVITAVLLAAVPFVVLVLTQVHDDLHKAQTKAEAIEDELGQVRREVEELEIQLDEQRIRTDNVQAKLELANSTIAECQVGAGLLASAARELLKQDGSIFVVSRYTRLAQARLDKCFDYNAIEDRKRQVSV